MTDNTNAEKSQAEALSTAIDALNQGQTPEPAGQAELAELIGLAKLVKAAAEPALPPAAVLEHIVEQSAVAINREKRKRRAAWGLLSLTGTAAAVVIAAWLHTVPPVLPEQQSAALPPAATTPAPLTVPVPAALPPAPVVPPADENRQPAAAERQAPEPAGSQLPPAGLNLPAAAGLPDRDSMLALPGSKADRVTVDAVSKTIRQIYRQGAPDEIIVTQAPSRANLLRAVPREQMKLAAADKQTQAKRNTVTVVIDQLEVTLEGAASETELLQLAQSLTKVPVPQ